MAIVERTRLYEALVRWNPDGSVAAHQATITEIVDDATGEVKSATINLPTSLQPADVAAVVGTSAPAWQAQLDAATTQVASLTQQVADAATAAQTAAGEAAQALATAQADAAAKADALTTMTAARDALQAQVDQLTAPPAIRSVQSYRFKAALRNFPSPSGVVGRTLREDVDAYIPTASGEVQDRWMAPEFARNDTMLNSLATTFVGGDAGQASTLLDAIFDAADQIP